MRTPGLVFVVRLRAGSMIRSLRAALKVLGRRFGLRAVSIRAEQSSEAESAGRQP